MMKSNEPGVGSAGEQRDECDLTCPSLQTGSPYGLIILSESKSLNNPYREPVCRLYLSKMREVCLFFSAISTSKLDSKRKTSKRSQPDEARESDDSNEESQINPSQILSQGKQIFLAISYWLACQTQNDSAVNLFNILRALVKCDLEFCLSRASRKKIPTTRTSYARF